MNDIRYPYHCKAYLGEFELAARLPAPEDDFATLAEATEWLRENGGGMVEKHDPKTGWTLIAAIAREEAGGGAAFSA